MNDTLYRKYRPLDFDSVIGQDHIVKTLKNQIENDKISHAYLFCGTRGTGKTTIAKIFARAVNCLDRKDANPCNNCENCLNILNGNDLNVYEIDAASNNSIDDIRNLKELVAYPPANKDKYKVFIIDEAHQLSQSAKDAFLKTLEEPPEYVIFILCTTQANQFKQTIISRCQRYDFRRIKNVDLVKNLSMICEKENIDITEEAKYTIALKSDGSMREAISLLDRIRGFTSDKITFESLKNILGVVSDDSFKNLTLALLNQDINEIIKTFNDLLNDGADINIFFGDYLLYLRNLMLIKNLDKPNDYINITNEKFDELKVFSKSLPLNTIIWYIEKLSKAQNDLRYIDDKKIILESILISLSMPENDISNESLLARLSLLEQKIDSRTFINTYDKVEKKDFNIDNENKNSDNNNDDIKDDNIEEIKNEEISKITINKDEDLNEISKNWNKIIAGFENLDKSLLSYKKIKILPSPNEKGIIDIIPNTDYIFDLLKDKKLIETLSEKTKDILGIDVKYNLKKLDKKIEKTKIEFDDLLKENDIKVEIKN